MRYLDLTKLLGGESLTTRVTLTKNGLAYKVSALLDSGANGYYFIDYSLLKSLSFFLHPLIQRLPTSIPIKGYNGASGTPITHYTLLNLTVDKRIQSFTPFLITHLGNHSVILGRTWLAEHQVLLDTARRRLIWPKDYLLTTSYSHTIEITDLRKKQINTRHQHDADRRNAALDRFCQIRRVDPDNCTADP